MYTGRVNLNEQLNFASVRSFFYVFGKLLRGERLVFVKFPAHKTR